MYTQVTQVIVFHHVSSRGL